MGGETAGSVYRAEFDELAGIVERLTAGKFKLVLEANETQYAYVTKVPPFGWWCLVPPEPFGRMFFKLASKLEVDVAEYARSERRHLPVRALVNGYQTLADAIIREATGT